MAPEVRNSDLSDLRQHVRCVRKLLSRARAKQVQAASIKNASRKLVNQYFTESRPAFESRGLDDESLGGVDNWAQELLTLTQKAALKSSYARTLKSIDQELNGVEIALLTASVGSRASTPMQLDGKEARIAATLASLVPSAGYSYEQACVDLRDDTRRSYRGAAVELREALREVLDHLAPDDTVSGQPNFKLESGCTKPTMKQKTRFILKSRGQNKAQTGTSENAVSVVESTVGALARSVYNRSSMSTHIRTSKQEVQHVKAYVDVLLGEILETM